MLSSQRERSFETKIRTLATLCECFRVCTDGGCLVPKGEAVATTPWEALRSQSDDALLNLLAVFDMADSNHDGWISRNELGLMVRTWL